MLRERVIGAVEMGVNRPLMVMAEDKDEVERVTV